MAIYRCDNCGRFLDGDYFPCVEHPNDPTAMCCEECEVGLTDEQELSERDQKMVDYGLRESDFL